MAKLVTYLCPDCGGKFDFLHHPSDELPPEQCELCGSYMGDTPQKAPVLHLNYGKEKNRVPDQVYRRMESASQARAEDAAALTGATVEEMSAIRITDMKDNTREGEHPAMLRATAAEKQLSTATMKPSMTSMGAPPAPEQQNPQAMAMIADAAQGPGAFSTRAMFNSMPHQKIISDATRNGSDGRRH